MEKGMPGSSQGIFLPSDNCWKGNRARHKQFRRILECGNEVIDRLARKTALPVLLQKIKSGVVMV